MENPSNLEYVLLVILSIICGLSVRIALSLAGQKWAMTYHHTLSYLLLPPVTMVITTLIAGNIALSLGMIGALSIVRFRNPVKNPFELVIYFALITIGIGTAVNFKLGLLITLILILVILFVKYYESFLIKKNKNLFSLSFDEGSMTHICEIKSTKPLKIVEENKNLIQFFSSKSPQNFNYKLAFSNRNELNNLKSEIENDQNVESIEIRYVP